MAKIERLTKQQKATIAAVREEYLRHGLSTEPADRPRATSAFNRIYERLKLKAPMVIWVGSPMAAHIAHTVLKNMPKVSAQVRDQVWAEVGDQVWDQVSAQVSAEVSAEVSAQVSAQVSAKVWAEVWDQVSAQVSAQVGAAKLEFLQTHLWGQHDAGWVAWAFAMVGIGVTLQSDTAHLFRMIFDLCQSCMWAYAFKGAVIACERPLSISRDERGRLHNEAGPAMEFRDGWEIYAVHGVRVPDWIIAEPSRLTIAAIHAEKNTEIQRVMIERYGWDRYADECAAKTIDHDERWGTLMRRGSGEGAVTFLKVINRSPEPDGSFRRYILPVDAQLRPIPDPSRPDERLGEPQELTALNAVASTFGMRGKEYAELLAAES